ncbi:hypothetical protein DQ384_19820 [Sphaerisporangium album]|uniref:Peptidase MA-like domain-containing protein n=2 Tax=Sphaerisporangium album TaxID=509200 RepID=A0A367FHP9_9ACTN|nr:hypothetical protein DQ384_19820 [Sphaerisporangium album]
MSASLAVGLVAVLALVFVVMRGQPDAGGPGNAGGVGAIGSPDSVVLTEERPGGPPESTPDSFQVAEDELRRAVEAHNRAFQAGDLGGYLKIFDQGDAELLEQQTNTFDNLRKLPFEEAAFEVQQGEGLAKDAFGNWISFSFDVTLEHRFDGVDLRPVAEWYRWTVAKAGENAPPTVTAVTGTPATSGDSETDSYPAPWDSWPDISVVTTEHTVVLTRSAQADMGARVAPLAEQAAVADLDFWARNGDTGTPVPARYMIVLAKGEDEQGNLFRRSKRQATEAGISISMLSSSPEEGSWYVGGSRIVTNSNAWYFGDVDGGVDELRELFHHEIAHSLLAPLEHGASLSSLDKWVVEGFAEYVATHGQSLDEDGQTPETRAYVRGERDRPFEGRIPDNASWDLHGLVGVNYQLSHLAMQMIAERYGEQKAVAFVLAHYRGKTADAALTEVLGIGREDFERQWAEYVRAKFA